jgi:hypothetical protein
MISAFSRSSAGSRAVSPRDRDLAGVLDSQAVGEGGRDGAVAGDAFGQRDGGGVLPLEEAFEAAGQEPQPGLHLQDGLAGHPEPEVAGFDETGVDRADRDLVHAGTVDGDEPERTGSGAGGQARGEGDRGGAAPSCGTAARPAGPAGGEAAQSPGARQVIARRTAVA